jgi:hypothetical protein
MPSSDWARAALWRFVATGVLALLGLLLVLVGRDSGVVWIAGSVLLGLALIFAVALVFYEVGRSEDRDRERGSH